MLQVMPFGLMWSPELAMALLKCGTAPGDDWFKTFFAFFATLPMYQVAMTN